MLHLEEISQDANLDTLTPILWQSYNQPFIPFLPLLFPPPDPTSSPTSTPTPSQIANSKHLLLRAHHADPSSHWLKVTDTTTGLIVGGARWHVYETNPYANEERRKKFRATMYGDGDDVRVRREFAEKALGQIFDARVGRYGKPHAQIQMCFVHPAHRHSGIGSLLVSWGVQRADSLGLDCFVESTIMARKLYEKFGFVVVSDEEADMRIEKPSEEWMALERMFMPYQWHCMWRPIGGKFVKGETQMPW